MNESIGFHSDMSLPEGYVQINKTIYIFKAISGLYFCKCFTVFYIDVHIHIYNIKMNIHYRMLNVFTSGVVNQRSLETLDPENI